LPDSYKKLAAYGNCLPGDEFLAGYPFGGIVLNLNVATNIHRDAEDLDLCLIIVVSHCIAGDLVLREPGIVLAQRNGDLSSFPSGDFSHYNMNYIGLRASIVFHSDHASQSWTGPPLSRDGCASELSTGRMCRHAGCGGDYVQDRNGWAKNIYLRRS
jgi:hypothetical protein